MDFLDDLEAYNSSMDNAYNFITKKITLDDIYEAAENEGELMEFYLPFDPIEGDGRDEATLELLISHFIETEDYEKCQELVNIKKKFLEAPKG
tara:strand:- start:171 stop:449 length:279 start_codon:yes stop_codon:yes gene_type:complete